MKKVDYVFMNNSVQAWFNDFYVSADMLRFSRKIDNATFYGMGSNYVIYEKLLIMGSEAVRLQSVINRKIEAL